MLDVRTEDPAIYEQGGQAPRPRDQRLIR